VRSGGGQQPDSAAGSEGRLGDLDAAGRPDPDRHPAGNTGPDPHRDRCPDGHPDPTAGAHRGATGGCASPDGSARPTFRGAGQLLSAEQFGDLLRAGRVMPHLRPWANRASRQWRTDRL